jgi:hypothetical protein
MAKSHAGQADAVEKLAAKIRDGGNGMTPHPDLTDAQKWILFANQAAGCSSPERNKNVSLHPEGWQHGEPGLSSVSRRPGV